MTLLHNNKIKHSLSFFKLLAQSSWFYIGVFVGAFFVVVLIFGRPKNTGAYSEPSSNVEPCKISSAATSTVSFNKAIQLSLGPSENANSKTKLQTNSETEKEKYLFVDNTMRAQILCIENSWARISVIYPKRLKRTHLGWVPTEAIRKVNTDINGHHIFTVDDFRWSKKLIPYKDSIVQNVNKLHRQDDRCPEIDTDTIDISTSDSTRTMPVFKISCYANEKLSIVLFSKSGPLQITDSLNAVTIPTDPKAMYYYLNKLGTSSMPILITKRIGTSGTTYSKRIFNCKDHTTKYLGTGDTIEEMENSPPSEKMGPIIPESIAWYHYLRACDQ